MPTQIIRLKEDAASEKNIDRKHNVRMWYLIQRTMKGPSSPAVPKVQTVKNQKTSTYTKQADIERVI